ncbi:MAG TPA: DUF1566 domain-containing protein [Syntrophales bacterium]|nr:DUF1566 domain-containing protein [Syntrophales bacterium]
MRKPLTILTINLALVVFLSFISQNAQPAVSKGNEIKRDGRFIAYDNGTVLDTKTNLMWAAKDSGSNVNWPDAKGYCENYRGGGYSDWRMPTQDELAGLYDASKGYRTACGQDAHLTEMIGLTCNWVWASETRGSKDAACFSFRGGDSYWKPQCYGNFSVSPRRALPVRNAK